MTATDWISALDAPLSVAVVVWLGSKIIAYLRQQIADLETEKVALISKLEATTAARLTDKDTAAKQFHETVVRVEQSLVRVADSRTAVLDSMARIEQKIGGGR